jgi:BetI-type transcriptional repressor, C-terminal
VRTRPICSSTVADHGVPGVAQYAHDVAGKQAGLLMGVVDKIAAESADPVIAGLMVEVLAQAHHDEQFAQVLAENDRRLAQGIADLIESAAAQGIIDPQLAPMTVARWMVILTDGRYGRGYPESDADRATDLDTVKVLISRILRLRSTAP